MTLSGNELSDLEAGLKRIREHPELLRPEESLRASLRFYGSNLASPCGR